MHSIVVDSVSKHWNGTVAVESVSFTVEAGHLVACSDLQVAASRRR